MKGEVVYLYAFDVANEIQTAEVKEVLAARPAPIEVYTDHTYPKDVPLYKPLTFELDRPQAVIGGRRARFIIRIYDVGVICVVARLPVEVAGLSELMPLHQPQLDSGTRLDDLARQLCREVCEGLQSVMVQPSPHSEPEAYTVFCLTELDGVTDVAPWLSRNQRDVAALLAETQADQLSDAQVSESLRVQRSFSRADALVIEWDAALVVDLGGYVDDVLYVLELANMQLEEYRRMDQRLDRYLNRAYEDVLRAQHGLFGNYSSVLSKLRMFRVDVTRLNDEVSYIGKFFGDWYLARVYLGASERFYLHHWRNSIEQRLEQVDKLYTVFNSEITNRRLLWLETLIVIFFAVDLVLLVLLKR